MVDLIIWVVVFFVVLLCAAAILAKFYERATREVSFVRTGIGGRKVVIDGGAFTFAWFHQISRINMQSTRLEVVRTAEESLITNDRLRVDVSAEFYISVNATADGISRAAQTLGARTFDNAKLQDLVEGKLVDAMRAVAARFTMDELHENRGKYVREVREALLEPLTRNGLDLDSVSLTALDQTPFKALDENNAFNAVGMRKLAEVIAKSRRERAEIDAGADVAVRRSAMEASRLKLQIDLDEQQAQIAQVQQIETLKAAQVAEVARHKVESELSVSLAKIALDEKIRVADLSRQRAIESAEIDQKKALDLSEQSRQIAISVQNQEEHKAKALAEATRAQMVKAVEAVNTAKVVAEAERRKSVAIIAASQEAEAAAVRRQRSAETDVLISAKRSESVVHAAQAAAQEATLRTQAERERLLVEAEGRQAVTTAENNLSELASQRQVQIAKIESLPKVVAEMVKPAEKIDSIRINQLSGFGQTGSGDATKAPVNQAIDALLGMAVQLPALKKLGNDIGLNFEDGIASINDVDPEK